MPHQLADTEIAYLAGFFDGEGCVMICCYQRKVRGGERAVYNLAVSASQVTKHREPLELLHQVFGGTLREPPRHNPKWQPVSVWSAKGYGAAKALAILLPYLKVKHKVASLGIEFQHAAEQYALAQKRREPLDFDFSAICSQLKSEVSQLNTSKVVQ